MKDRVKHKKDVGMGLCHYVDLKFELSLPCLHTCWHAIPTSFYIFFNMLQVNLIVIPLPPHSIWLLNHPPIHPASYFFFPLISDTQKNKTVNQ